LAWKIEYNDTATKQLGRLDRQIAKRIVDYMDKRIAPFADPRSMGKALTGPLGNLWRYRVGDYRVICAIENEALRVLVVRLGHRGDVYRRP
jgi:mRNA interferase RelE/StbE